MPEFSKLEALSSKLSRAGIVHALGGSGLLSYLGLPVDVNDWDITTEAPLQDVAKALGDYEYRKLAQDGVFKSEYALRLKLGHSDADIIGSFAVLDEQQTVSIQTTVTGYWESVPVGSPSEWLKVYRAVNNPDKTRLLESYLQAKPNAN